MPNKQRKFKVIHTIVFHGSSKAKEGETTFQEELINDFLSAFCQTMKNKFKTIYVDHYVQREESK